MFLERHNIFLICKRFYPCKIYNFFLTHVFVLHVGAFQGDWQNHCAKEHEMHSSPAFHTFLCKCDNHIHKLLLLLAEINISSLYSPHQIHSFTFHKTRGSSFNKGVTSDNTNAVVSPNQWARWNSTWNSSDTGLLEETNVYSSFKYFFF